ncbi:L-serine ammonia-lyase, iron-sulfur-dependent subunit beta [Deinococcus radiophilus]|uniref:L-serine dehydratase n=1 Tax=Deinococcus radiophilus TaxID=32062 RepID=A0A3S0KGW6_9DEIO|nr:L-serine ammonia-lyase, iron-sulfur-dependent subunit beta [Deinococcus radiophilus]RTR30277.1 L-serine ammonia-lyase, iron-sulfur-dependent, subunit beta [Deinococcus radiophilus]UFA49927.1 L-serine ammonia-lyase, iron-sulfur-dependent subunit beta [Deinococcus radiophilus]
MTLLDMVGPVMVGPSSSHTAGACRIGLAAHHLLGEVPRHADIGLHASFAKTGRGHGTHFALVAGLLGYAPDDPRLPGSFGDARELGVDFNFSHIELADVHPNTARIRAAGHSHQVDIIASSTGGGVILITRINGVAVQLSAAYPTLLLQYQDRPSVLSRITTAIAAEEVNIATLNCTRDRRGGTAMVTIELDGPGIHPDLLNSFRRYSGMQWVQLMPKLMDG